MGWPELLDEMEAGLGAHARALYEGAEPPAGVAVPPDIGPLPPELRERAERVLGATRVLEAEFEQRRSELLAAMRRASRVDHRDPAAYIDARA